MKDLTQASLTKPWHALSVEETLSIFETGERGLSESTAKHRIDQYGRNELPVPPRRHPLLRFLAQFNNALVIFLLAAAGLSAVLRHWVDALVIVMVVGVNAIVGVVQEGRAEQALGALRSMLSPSARVLRDGKIRALNPTALVPGDVVVIEAGDRVPADLRLLSVRGLLVDEAILTGESVASEKLVFPVEERAALGDRRSMAYSGTLVAAGRAHGVVVATGVSTEIGHISTLLRSVESLTTPLLRQINQFGRRITLFAILLALALFAFAVFWRGHAWVDTFMIVVALAVSIVPEGLPAVITITLAIGVQRMAKRNAIVRRLPAVETLGATSVVCSDKTGTLTRNEMTVRRLVTTQGEVTVDGYGYAPEGDLNLPTGTFRSLIEAGIFCNDAHLEQKNNEWRVNGDPMEGALIVLAFKAGIDATAERTARAPIDEIPFDAQHRFMATLQTGRTGQHELSVKGAPEQVLALCTHQMGADGAPEPLDPDAWHARIAETAANGERVLGFAVRRFENVPPALAVQDINSLTFLGIMGFIDPPRDEARAAIAECHSAGIAVKMITGDHASTASAIAEQLGIAMNPRVVTGHELDQVDDVTLRSLAHEAHVFARTNPEHKLRVVQALQWHGAVVAMTGDGVNDAPSLKQADVGIAMGKKGTEAAKEAAEMVLADDNFASIVHAIQEGRTVYDNIRKVIAWTLPTNGGEVLAIILALMFGMTFPMTPAQVLWINMILTITLGLVLAFEPAEKGSMQRAPRLPDASLISSFMLWRIVLVSILFTLGVFGIFTWALHRGYGVDLARTMVVNTLCVLEIFYLFNVRYLRTTALTLKALRGTPAVLWAILGVVVAQFAFTYAPFMNSLFDTKPVPFLDGVLIVAVGVAVMTVLEIEKIIIHRLNWFKEAAPRPPGRR